MGITRDDIDLFNNPYIKMNVYDINEDEKPKLSEKIKLKKCIKEDLLEFVPERST